MNEKRKELVACYIDSVQRELGIERDMAMARISMPDIKRCPAQQCSVFTTCIRDLDKLRGIIFSE
jgi:hypothetical protein